MLDAAVLCSCPGDACTQMDACNILGDEGRCAVKTCAYALHNLRGYCSAILVHGVTDNHLEPLLEKVNKEVIFRNLHLEPF